MDDAAATSRWQGFDQTLDRPVAVLVVGIGHPHATAMLDAARRAAGVEDARLVRVLDVGNDQSTAYVVTEWVEGSTLTERLRSGPLEAQEVRTMLGESALALEHARHRGLHHLELSPDDVHLLDDESIKLAGLAVRAALAGHDFGDGTGTGDTADTACAVDTTALVALTYAGLTGYWPLPGRTGLPPAPQVAGSPAAPSEIVSGVPADLDTLCAQTFAGAGAPNSPGDLASQVAPWGRARHPMRATGAFPLPLAPVQSAPATHPDEPDSSDPAPTAVLPVSPAKARATPGAPAAPRKRPTPAKPAKRTKPATPAAPRRTQPIGSELDTDLFEEHRERPAPLVPPTPLSRPAGTQTRTVLLLVLGFVGVFFLLAYFGIRGLGDNAFVAGPRQATATSAPPTAAPPAATPTPTAATAAAAAVKLAAVTSFDPQGDGEEKDSLVWLAVDGDPTTSWTSDTYRSPTFGGLKKGVGLLLDLGAPVSVRSVAVAVGGSGSTLELLSASGNTLEGAKVVAKAGTTSGTAEGTLSLTPASPVTSRYFVLWFTTAPSRDGGYRIEVNEVSVS